VNFNPAPMSRTKVAIAAGSGIEANPSTNFGMTARRSRLRGRGGGGAESEGHILPRTCRSIALCSSVAFGSLPADMFGLFFPLAIRGLTLANRVFVSPTCQYSS
jgi:hypothetical protein